MTPCRASHVLDHLVEIPLQPASTLASALLILPVTLHFPHHAAGTSWDDQDLMLKTPWLTAPLGLPKAQHGQSAVNAGFGDLAVYLRVASPSRFSWVIACKKRDTDRRQAVVELLAL